VTLEWIWASMYPTVVPIHSEETGTSVRNGFATSTTVSGVFDLCVHPTELRTIALAAIQRVTRRWQLPNARCGF
jgi:hypothetical protein